VGSMVYKDLFDGRGKKRKYQLQGGRVPLRECVVTDRRVAHAKTMSFRPSRQVLEEAGCPALNGCPTQSDRANEALSRCTMVFLRHLCAGTTPAQPHSRESCHGKKALS